MLTCFLHDLALCRKLRYGMEIFLAAQPNLSKVKVVAHFTSNKLSSYLFLLSSSLKLSMRSNDLNAPSRNDISTNTSRP